MSIVKRIIVYIGMNYGRSGFEFARWAFRTFKGLGSA